MKKFSESPHACVPYEAISIVTFEFMWVIKKSFSEPRKTAAILENWVERMKKQNTTLFEKKIPKKSSFTGIHEFPLKLQK